MAFRPDDIDDLVVWLEAEDLEGYSDLDEVDVWYDRSGYGHHANPGASDQKPLFFEGRDRYYQGRPGVAFGSVNDDDRMYISATTDIAKPYMTLAFAVTLTSNQVNGVWLFNYEANSISSAYSGRFREGRFETLTRHSTATSTIARSPSTAGGENGVPNSDGWHSVICQATTNGAKTWINGELQASTAFPSSIITTSPGNFTLGNHPTISTDQAARAVIGTFLMYASTSSSSAPSTSTDIPNLHNYLMSRYKQSSFVKESGAISLSTVASNEYRNCSIALDEENDRYVMAVIPYNNASVYWATAPVTDPHNFALVMSTGGGADALFTTTGSSARTVQIMKHSGTWHAWYDDHTTGGNGIYHYSGTDIANMSKTTGGPVLTRSTAINWDWVRAPAVVHDGSQFHMFLDIRTDAVTGEIGFIAKATSPDGVTWTKTTESDGNPLVEASGNTWRGSDVGHPSVKKIGNVWWMAYAGFNKDDYWNATIGSDFPHQIGWASSTDLETWTKEDTVSPALIRSGTTSSPLHGDYIQQSYPEIHCPKNGDEMLYYVGEGPSDTFSLFKAKNTVDRRTMFPDGISVKKAKPGRKKTGLTQVFAAGDNS